MSSIAELAREWGNEQWAASIPFVERCVQEAEDMGGTIVECGSGLTTIALMETSKHLVSLEHDPAWVDKIQSRHADAPVYGAPLRSYDTFDWYEPPFIHPRSVTLLVVDGPPGKTRGGRFGAVPVLWNFLAPELTILLDDVHRFSELDTLSRWEGAFRMSGAKVQIELAQCERPFAVMKVSR